MTRKRESRIREKTVEENLMEELSGIDDAVEMGAPEMVDETPEMADEAPEGEEHSYEGNFIDMTSVKSGHEHEIMTKAVKNEFNPNSTQDALTDSEDEGGVYVYRSASSGMASSNQGGLFKGTSVSVEDNQVELSGFKATVNFGDGDQSIDVRAAFNDINTAKASINGDKFIFIDKGAMCVGTITSGAPIIANDERELAIFVNGEWKRP